MYHLGHTKAGPPIPLTQGMNNISCYPPPPHPRTRKLISSPSFSHEVNWRSLIKAAVFSWKLGSRYSSAQIPHTRFFLIPHSGSSSYHITIFPQLHCYLSSRPGKNTHTPCSPPLPGSCNSFIHFSVQGFMCSLPPPPWSHQKNDDFSAPPPSLSVSLKQSGGPLQLKTRATNRFSRHFAPVLSGSSSTG